MTRHAVFRADAGPTLGAGHVMRCLTLADALGAEGWSSTFAVSETTIDFCSALRNSEHRILVLESADSPNELRKRCGESPELLVVDHYGLDARFESSLSDWCGRLLVIDDLADRPHVCGLLLDQTPGRTAHDYAGKVPEHCQLLFGPAFALVRPRFAELRERSLSRRRQGRPVAELVLAFGAADSDNVTCAALDALRAWLPSAKVRVTTILGSRAPHLGVARERVAALGETARLCIDVEQIADLLANTDLVLGAAGTSSWERCSLGVPSVVTVIADNQRFIAAELDQRGAVVLADPRRDALGYRRLVTEICASPQRLSAMSHRAAAICDGLGAQRIVKALEDGSPSNRN